MLKASTVFNSLQKFLFNLFRKAKATNNIGESGGKDPNTFLSVSKRTYLLQLVREARPLRDESVELSEGWSLSSQEESSPDELSSDELSSESGVCEESSESALLSMLLSELIRICEKKEDAKVLMFFVMHQKRDSALI